MNRKSTIFVLLTLLAMVLTFHALGDTVVEQVFTSRSPFQYAVSSNGLWIVTDDSLLWYRDEMYQPEKLADAVHVVHIASDDSCLYYVTEDNGIQFLNELYTGGIAVLQSTMLQCNFQQIEVANGHLWGLREDGVLCSVYDSDGSAFPMQMTGFENSGITTFSGWQQYIIVYQESVGRIVLLDTAVNSVIATATISQPVEWIQVLDVSEESASAAVMASGNVRVIDLLTGSMKELPLRIPADCAGLRRNATVIFTLGDDYRTLYKLPVFALLEKEAQNRTLTIVNSIGDDQVFDAAVVLFHQKYPDVVIVERWIDDPRIIATEVMAGGDGIDIIGMQESFMTISSGFLLKSGAIVDLSTCPELDGTKCNYRDVFGITTINGQWYGVPESIEMHLWQVNPTLAEHVGCEIPEGRWTWADFVQLAEAVISYNQTAEKPVYLLQEDSLLLPYFFLEYQANHMNILDGTVDFDSDAYCSLLDMWKWLNDEHLITSAVDRHNPSMRKDTLLWSYRTPLCLMGSAEYIYPPTETAESGIPVYCCSLVLNSRSPMREEAAYFLQCLMVPDSVNQGAYWPNGQMLSDAVFDTDNEAENEIYHVSAKNEQLWNAALTVGIPELYLYDIQREQAQTLLPGLLNGTVNAQRFAMISQQLADMALGE